MPENPLVHDNRLSESDPHCKIKAGRFYKGFVEA